jgi:hypothetical protein
MIINLKTAKMLSITLEASSTARPRGAGKTFDASNLSPRDQDGRLSKTNPPARTRKPTGCLGEGPFSMIMRLYWPKEAAVEGKWKQPPVQRVI